MNIINLSNKYIKCFTLSTIFLISLINPSNALESNVSKNTKNSNKSLKYLSLNQAIKIGLENNYKIKSEFAKIGINDAEITTASLIPNPGVMLDLSPAQQTYRFGLQNIIELGNKRELRISEAESRKEIFQTHLNLIISEFKSDLKKAYYEVYLNNEKQNQYSKLISLSEDLLDVSRKKEIAGDIPQLEVTQTELTLLNLKNESAKISYNLKQSFSKLKNLLGINISDDTLLLKPEDKLTECFSKTKNTVLTNEIINQAVSQRIEIKELDLEINSFNLKKELSLANVTPDPTVSYGIDLVYGDYLISGGFAGISFDIPVFNKNQGYIQEYDARSKQALLEKDFLKDKITFELNQAFTSYRQNLALKENFEKNIIPIAEETVKKSIISFQSGKSNILSAISIQETFVNIQINYLQVLADFQNSIIDLERITGCI